ncbi:MAG: MFS transporter, partial [Bacteroidales bacterium]|nr:MFS transporter [Bacteroidales bacterium]
MKKRKIYNDGCVAQHEAGNTAFAVLFAISLAHLLNDMIQSVVPAIYPMLKDNYALTFGQIGMITLVYQMTSSVLQPFVGLYADRHPRPYSLAFGMCLTLAGLLTLAFSASYA